MPLASFAMDTMFLEQAFHLLPFLVRLVRMRRNLFGKFTEQFKTCALRGSLDGMIRSSLEDADPFEGILELRNPRTKESQN